MGVKKKRVKARKKEIKKPLVKKKVRIKYEKVLLGVIALILFFLLVKLIYDTPIKNIIIKGNYYLTDQDVIDLAGIRNYPSTFANSSYVLKNKLEEVDLIESVRINKTNLFTKVIIEINENRPLLYYQPAHKTVLEDGTMIEETFNVPFLINQVPDTVYQELIEDMAGVPLSVLDKMSEIQYVPTDVDPELFLISMNDGIYVYVTLSKFERLYDYIEYAEGFENKKGILHLDSGDYLEIIEEE